MKLASWLSRSDGNGNPSLGFPDWQQMFTYGGLAYWLTGQSTLAGQQEPIGNSFRGYVDGAYKRNGIIFACSMIRQLLFSEARFQFQRIRAGRPGDLFGTPALKVLETPWVDGTTSGLLTRMMQDVDLAGNFYALRQGTRRDPTLMRLQPDWVTIVIGSRSDRPDWRPGDLDSELVGYAYQPGGPSGGRDVVGLDPRFVVHWDGNSPDPSATYRGMSWLTPILREIIGDNAATDHKIKFLESGATPNTVVRLNADVKADEFERWVKTFKKEQEQEQNPYKWLYLGGGADVSVVGSDMRRLDFKNLQAAGETRIAAAAGVPPVIAGFSEGLEAATYSNYSQARRRFADGTLRPLWRSAAGALSAVVDVPNDTRLWYDDRDISFLQEDQKDAAEIQQTKAVAIKMLVEAGYDAKSVIEAIEADDFSRLTNAHSGLFSVQLQPAGKNGTPNGQPNGVPALPVPAAE